MYADDVQIYISFKPQFTTQTEHKIKACLSDVRKWMNNNFLKLNPNKTNFILLSSKHNLTNIPLINLNFNNCSVPPSESVISLGVNITNTLDYSKFISKKVQSCSFHLKNLYHIKNSLPIDTRIILVTNIILSNLDYCNSLLIGATNKDIKPLQRVMNRSLRFIFNIKRIDHVTPYAVKAHFLPVIYRIQFKVCLMAFKIINGMSPDYLSEGLDMFQPTTAINLRWAHGRDQFMFKLPPMTHQRNLPIYNLITNWNALPYQIRTIDKLGKFKTMLKTHLFSKAYPQFINQNP